MKSKHEKLLSIILSPEFAGVLDKVNLPDYGVLFVVTLPAKTLGNLIDDLDNLFLSALYRVNPRKVDLNNLETFVSERNNRLLEVLSTAGGIQELLVKGFRYVFAF